MKNIVWVLVFLAFLGGLYYYQFAQISPTTIEPLTEGNIETNPNTVSTVNSPSAWKIYTNSKQGYSFQYPEKLSLSTLNETVSLSHTIPFENYNGGCDMKGDAELSKTLQDFGLSIKVVAGKVNPPYVDGSYLKGELDGKWAYMGAEGCGVTTFYFPLSDERTLLVTRNHLQTLSSNVTPEVRAKVLAVPGVISSEESEMIIDKILSSIKITSTAQSNTYTYRNHGITLELPKGFVPEDRPAENGPAYVVTLPAGGLTYVTDASWWVKYSMADFKYIKDQKIGETTFKVYEYSDHIFYWFRQGNVGYEFSVYSGVDKTSLENLLKTFRFVGWVQ